MTDRIEEKQNIVKIVENIWRRSRHNAFAHKCAAERSERCSTMLFVLEIFFSLSSICFIVLTYMLLATDNTIFETVNPKQISFYSTLASVICALGGMFFSVLNNYMKNDVKNAEHRSALGLYQLIAQKARVVRWPDMPYEEMVRVLKGLEESFQLLKARGREPNDKDFDKALKIFGKIVADPESKLAQSFNTELLPEKPSWDDAQTPET